MQKRLSSADYRLIQNRHLELVVSQLLENLQNIFNNFITGIRERLNIMSQFFEQF